jgi:2-isopropylmalate synthase
MGVAQSESMFFEAEAPQASRELAELRRSAEYIAPFEVVRRRVIDDSFEGRMTIDATVVVRVNGVDQTEAASGVGVVNAFDNALRKALLKYFPFLESVRVIETYAHASGESTEAEVMSIKKFSDGRATWTTLAKSTNLVEAGWRSLVDGYEWRVVQEIRRQRKMTENLRTPRR